MIDRAHTTSRMSQYVAFQNVVYLAGQVGTPDQSIESQTQETLDRIEALLAEAGSDRSRILRAEIWLDDMRDFAAVNSIWEGWVPEGTAPARASGQVRVGRPGLKVEIIVTAARRV
jgi:enamine deaminase RidA (YjgF/YER057c/UK114 family)